MDGAAIGMRLVATTGPQYSTASMQGELALSLLATRLVSFEFPVKLAEVPIVLNHGLPFPHELHRHPDGEALAGILQLL